MELQSQLGELDRAQKHKICWFGAESAAIWIWGSAKNSGMAD